MSLRKHPYLTFWLAAEIAGHKLPFEFTDKSSDARDAEMHATKFGILPLPPDHPNFYSDANARMVDAWQRLDTAGRTSHDLTNLIIEWVRRWCPFATKLLCGVIVYARDLWVLSHLVRWFLL